MTLGEKLKELREKRGWTQQQAADHIEVSSQVISNYERDYREPSKDILVRIANVYNTTVDELLGRSLIIDSTILTDLYEKFNNYPDDMLDSMLMNLAKSKNIQLSEDIQFSDKMRQDMRRALVNLLIKKANYEVEVHESERELINNFRENLTILHNNFEELRKAKERNIMWEEKITASKEKIKLAEEETERILKETEELKISIQRAKDEELKAIEETEKMKKKLIEIDLEKKELEKEKIRLENILKGLKQ